jgi:hypothetical protein
MKEILKHSEPDFEENLWKDSLFVFDSSALLNFYEYSEKSRREIYKTVFKKLKGRLWMANHTEYEYLKNRKSVLLKPKELYNDLINKHFEIKQFEIFKNQYNQLKNRTKKTDKHPFIAESVFEEFDKQIDVFDTHVNDLVKRLKEIIENKNSEIDKIATKDTVLTAISKHFKVTDGYTFDKLLELSKEGELRYRNSIPPGYEDLKDKIGIQIYGDLIIWKQIIDLAEKEKKPIILIIDDLKIDWCYKNRKDKNIIDSPREELIKEMLDKCGVYFWAYSSNQFLYKSNEILGSILSEKVISEVKESNIYNIGSIVEELVFQWASKYFEEEGIVEFVGDNKDYGVDLLLNTEDPKSNIGIEIKYYPKFRLQSIKSLINRINPRFVERGYFEKFDHLILIVACENRELAIKINESKYAYEKEVHKPIDVRIGYINDNKEFELIE